MFPQMGKKRARAPIISMTPYGHVSYIEMSLVTSAMYHVRKHILRPPADSRAESELRNGENDRYTSCTMKRASRWADICGHISDADAISSWFKTLEDIFFRHVNLRHTAKPSSRECIKCFHIMKEKERE